MEFPKNILLIDDDSDEVIFFESALKSIDHSIALSYSQTATDALSILKENTNDQPDVIFLDWNMPKIDGRKCLTEIRKLDKYASLPVIVYTTSSASADQDLAMKAGASYFLTKTQSVLELRDKLIDVLSMEWDNE